MLEGVHKHSPILVEVFTIVQLMPISVTRQLVRIVVQRFAILERGILQIVQTKGSLLGLAKEEGAAIAREGNIKIGFQQVVGTI